LQRKRTKVLTGKLTKLKKNLKFTFGRRFDLVIIFFDHFLVKFENYLQVLTVGSHPGGLFEAELDKEVNDFGRPIEKAKTWLLLVVSVISFGCQLSP
jgi:hypothetical protein